jgi:hypothetical protein
MQRNVWPTQRHPGGGVQTSGGETTSADERESGEAEDWTGSGDRTDDPGARSTAPEDTVRYPLASTATNRMWRIRDLLVNG